MWETLKTRHQDVATRSIASLFSSGARASRFSMSHNGLLFDYSKTNLDFDILNDFKALLDDVDFEAKREAMFSGAAINETEGRSVLHIAPRVAQSADWPEIVVDGEHVLADTRAGHARLESFAHDVRSGAWPGDGVTITDVVNIGIGGSDLGPAMAVQALSPYGDGPKCHFVANADGADLHDTLFDLDPHTTMVIVASKSFTTLETMQNARSALAWMSQSVPDAPSRFVAISSAVGLTSAIGIPDSQVFGFGSYIGGRYSVWSPIGLSLMVSIGPEAFSEFLKGGLDMDQHFLTTPALENMPVLLALVGLWHHQICGYGTRAVIPYEQRLARLPAYLQQLEMESNGKGVDMQGNPLEHGGGPVVWGEPGTNGQHAFFQLIHQGQQVVPCEFLVGANGHEPDLRHHHKVLVGNCLAQSEALMRGKTLEVAYRELLDQGIEPEDARLLASQKTFSGNRPSTTLVYPKLTPFVLGQIIALYEHRVFVEGVALGINSFDQWGVEFGKELARAFAPAFEGGALPEDANPSTAHLLEYVLKCEETRESAD
ncbi:glucose-6-phosphate isomerase [Shimia litoralis]|uniref:Glucose-6-phosphate isomerase n=1 Tax=Shimia litoralis TaxID=420403 RepID=A0A4U7N5S7_9RHOB|nr:glucose-6-phosphate isomerase [Shimia litoralis]TKZ21202.1 glucose-6-phosphate isomerase [Shimia litoralis]